METKKKKAARKSESESTQLSALAAAALADWPTRLMRNLERASKQYWSICVSDNRFVVASRDSNLDTHTHRFHLTPVGQLEQWCEDSDWSQMDDLEFRLDCAEAAGREAARKAAIIKGAVAKLTAEECKELGL